MDLSTMSPEQYGCRVFIQAFHRELEDVSDPARHNGALHDTD